MLTDIICDVCHKFLTEQEEVTESIDGSLWCQNCLDSHEDY